ncbi:hypothetical protein F5I97DRAFT_1883858 [Phlebopus sp. FC_14]|nr:hypothetical protein F5I97DRAFT_1883858 [Phlebopus sp. FC_14]
MTGLNFGSADRKNLAMLHGTSSVAGPSSFRDASNTGTAAPWRHSPTPIYPSNRYPAQTKGHDNPFQFRNDLNRRRRPGNPNVSQTILAKPRSIPILQESRPAKRPKLDSSLASNHHNHASSLINDSLPSMKNSTLHHGSISEPEIQEVEPPRTVKDRSRHDTRRTNDAETIIIGSSNDDVGEPVIRPAEASSPDPLLLTPNYKHAFETFPGQLHGLSSRKGKERAKENVEHLVSASEEDEIEDFTSDPPFAKGDTASKKSPAIPNGIVQRQRRKFESIPTVRHQGVPAIDLVSMSRPGRVANQMKRKGEVKVPTSGRQVIDSVGTSSSNFINTGGQRDRNLSLPLEAWYFGCKLFPKGAGDSPYTFNYNPRNKTLTVVSPGRPPRTYTIKLDRAVDEVKITNDDEKSLKDDVVIQFKTNRGNHGELRQYELELGGCFEAGSPREHGGLTFLFATSKQGWTQTIYQSMVTQMRKAFRENSIETIRPSGGKSIWEMAKNASEMYDQQNSSTSGDICMTSRSPPLCSSSVKARTPIPDTNAPSSAIGPPLPRRSARQSAAQSEGPSLGPPAEPDELILMYPPSGTGALNIMRSDLKRLGPEEYLNDTLVEFGLKLWLNDLRETNPVLADQIHVFSSFFYKKLNKKNAEEGYQSVRKWTSKIDLFAKKYVIVPINENIHWYLAIIYEPEHTLQPPLQLQPSLSARTTRQRKNEKKRAGPDVAPVNVPQLPQEESTPGTQEADADADVGSVDGTCATTPSITQDEDVEDVSVSAFEKFCSVSAACKPTSDGSSRSDARIDSPVPSLLYPTSPARDEEPMDVDVTAPNPPSEEAGVSDPSATTPASRSAGIPASKFYASSSWKGIEKAVEAPVVIVDEDNSNDDQQQEAEVDDMLTPSQTADVPLQTYIFTFDSLGSRHAQAIKVLKNYLNREAKDKRGYDEVRGAIGKQVQVPVQPNTWDCGVYLLHLTKVFMSAPEDFFRHITTSRGTIPSAERKKKWEDHEVPLFRDYLASRINQLSETWKAEKATKEEESKKRKSEEVDAEVLSSEGEVDIVEDVPKLKETSPKSIVKRHATRLRG